MMRHRRSSYLRSFSSGLLLAGLPIAAFLGADYLLAPPGDGSSKISVVQNGVSMPSGAAVTSRAALAAAVLEENRAAAGKLAETAGQPIEAPAPVRVVQTSAGVLPLVSSIQTELKRVGCLADSADGVWDDKTRVAMNAFNKSVRVNLPTDRPDYILLTLLQGHSSKACNRSCNGEVGADGQCVDRSIQARTLAPAVPFVAPVILSEKAVTKRSTDSWAKVVVKRHKPSSVASAGQDKPVPAARPLFRAVGEIRPTGGDSAVASVNSQTSTRAQVTPSSEPLPGLMAVGAPPPVPAPAEIVRQAPVQRAVRVSPTRPRVSKTSGNRKTRLRRTFSDLNLSSP